MTDPDDDLARHVNDALRDAETIAREEALSTLNDALGLIEERIRAVDGEVADDEDFADDPRIAQLTRAAGQLFAARAILRDPG